jgi:hypothetical protein
MFRASPAFQLQPALPRRPSSGTDYLAPCLPLPRTHAAHLDATIAVPRRSGNRPVLLHSTLPPSHPSAMTYLPMKQNTDSAARSL